MTQREEKEKKRSRPGIAIMPRKFILTEKKYQRLLEMREQKGRIVMAGEIRKVKEFYDEA